MNIKTQFDYAYYDTVYKTKYCKDTKTLYINGLQNYFQHIPTPFFHCNKYFLMFILLL